MLKRPIPSTGEMLPVIGCGTWQTFDVGEAAAQRRPLRSVLQTLLDGGGAVIDTSPMYGRSESVVGALLADMRDRDHAFIATKVWTRGQASGSAQMARSMDLLKTRPIDLMQIHNLLDWQTHLPALREW